MTKEIEQVIKKFQSYWTKDLIIYFYIRNLRYDEKM